MRKNFFLLCFGFLIYTNVCAQLAPHLTNDTLNKFKIVKLDSINNVYIIYGSKKEQLFRILSRKNLNSMIWGHEIKIGEFYSFKLDSFFRPTPKGSPFASVHLNSINFHGTSISREKRDCESCTYNLYTSNNLVGLCVKYFPKKKLKE